jgi:hypothetical protein
LKSIFFTPHHGRNVFLVLSVMKTPSHVLLQHGYGVPFSSDDFPDGFWKNELFDTMYERIKLHVGSNNANDMVDNELMADVKRYMYCFSESEETLFLRACKRDDLAVASSLLKSGYNIDTPVLLPCYGALPAALHYMVKRVDLVPTSMIPTFPPFLCRNTRHSPMCWRCWCMPILPLCIA